MFLIINGTVEIVWFLEYWRWTLLPLIGLIMIAAIFTVAFWISSGRNPPLFSRTTLCPDCGGTGKMPDEAPDSADLQFVDCGRCEGSGEIDLDDLV